MPNTTFQNLPYPAPTDPVDVPGDIQALAEAIDTKMLDKAVIAAKGDLLVGLADNTITVQSIGTNNHVLVADSSVSTTSMKWAQVGTSSIADGAVTSGKLAANAAVPAGVINPFAGVNAPDGWLLCNGSDVSRSTYAALWATFGTSFTSATTTNASKNVSGLSGMTSAMIGWGIAGTNIPSGATISSITNATTVVISVNATGTASGTANIAISPYGFTGAGNTTTFLLPDMTGRVPVARDTGQTEFDILGERSGAKTVTLDSTQMPVHSHSGTTATALTNGSITVAGGAGTSAVGTHVTGFSASATASLPDNSNNLPGGNHDHTFTTSDAGGSGGTTQAHNNLQPYIVLNYIIKT